MAVHSRKLANSISVWARRPEARAELAAKDWIDSAPDSIEEACSNSDLIVLCAPVERIIEIATLITDGQLNIVAEGPELVIHQSPELLDAMDDWNKQHHGASGLIDRVTASDVTEESAEAQTLSFVREHCVERSAPRATWSVGTNHVTTTRSERGFGIASATGSTTGSSMRWSGASTQLTVTTSHLLPCRSSPSRGWWEGTPRFPCPTCPCAWVW